jgi:hypothetical protein
VVRPAGRVALLLGGASAIAVALSPEPGYGGTTMRHIVATGIGFATLAIWPCLAIERGPSAPWPLRPSVSTAFTVLVLATPASP